MIADVLGWTLLYFKNRIDLYAYVFMSNVLQKTRDADCKQSLNGHGMPKMRVINIQNVWKKHPSTSLMKHQINRFVYATKP